MRPTLLCLALLIQACAVEVDTTPITEDAQLGATGAGSVIVPPPPFTVQVSCFLSDGSTQIQAVVTTNETFITLRPECLAAGGDLLIEISPSPPDRPVTANAIVVEVLCQLAPPLENTFIGQGHVSAPGGALDLRSTCVLDGGSLAVEVYPPPVYGRDAR